MKRGGKRQRNLPWLAALWLVGTAVVWGQTPTDEGMVTMKVGPDEEWLRPGVSAVTAIARDGTKIPATVVGVDEASNRVVRFQRHAEETWYWLYDPEMEPDVSDQELLGRLQDAVDVAFYVRMKQTDTAVPPESPAWIPGYRVRYRVRLIGDYLSSPTETVIVRLPTGGWLKPDGTDVLVTTAVGRRRPAIVLSHDPQGDTLVQFRRHEGERWYWVYASNPEATEVDPALLQRIADARKAAEETALRKMAALKVAGERVGIYRNKALAIEKERDTEKRAQQERAEWLKLLPERETAVSNAAARVAAAKDKAEKTAAELAPLQKPANEKTARAVEIEKQVAAARQALTEAATAVEAAKQQGDQAAVAAAENARASAEKKLTAAEEAAKAAQEEAQAARIAAEPALRAQADAQKELADAEAAQTGARNAVAEAQMRITELEGMISKAQAAAAALAPEIEPLQKAAEEAQAAADRAAAEAAAAEQTHLKLALEADPRLHQEGLTVEFREWAGDDLGRWAAVVEGLQQSSNIVGSAIARQVLHVGNPFQPSSPRRFAASYRGFLQIDTPGVYSFFVNSDDAAFLFINQYKVYSRAGFNRPITGVHNIYAVGADIQLEAGVYPFEVHHVVGNTPDGQGLCALAWLRPGSKQWEFVPPTAFRHAAIGAVTAVEAWDGGPLAVFDYGVDDAFTADGLTLYLVRFEAQHGGIVSDHVEWSFGDGARRRGASATHLYVRPGDVTVTLKSHPKMPAFQRRCHIWAPPTPSSPHSLARAVSVLNQTDLSALGRLLLDDMYHFLLICGQPERWPAMERVCRELLKDAKLDVAYRADVRASLMEAMARQGRGREALAELDAALAEMKGVRSAEAQVLMGAANVAWNSLRDLAAAEGFYARVIRENERARLPLVRRAAVAWADMYLEAGDTAKAAATYRLAAGLGRGGPGGERLTDAVTRGALLRVAEQQLKSGNPRQSLRLLRRIEEEFPEQKMEGLYRFLRAEADRIGGRYDAAVRNYEAVLEMRQWAGYQPAALAGLADTYRRMGDEKQALEWYRRTAESFPAFFEERQLSNTVALLENQLARREAQGEGATNTPPVWTPFAGYMQDFEGLAGQTNRLGRAYLLPAMGLVGPHVAFVDAQSGTGVEWDLDGLKLHLQNILGGGKVWLEFWYRDTAGISPEIQPRVRAWMATLAPGAHPNHATDAREVRLEPTFGRWRKVATRLNLPQTQDAVAKIVLAELAGLYEVDGVSVRPITDREEDAFLTFVEGVDPQ